MKFFKSLTLSMVALGITLSGAMAAPESVSDAELKVYSNNPIIATVDDKPIYLNDVVNKRIHDLMQQLYEAVSAELPEKIMERLAESHKEVRLKTDFSVTEQQILAFYQQNNLSSRGSLDQLRSQIKQYLEQREKAAFFSYEMAKAFEKGWVATYLEPPEDFVVSASTKTAIIRNNPDAKVMLLEFSDYQCPFCGRVQPTINTLMEKYKGQLTFAYRHFPLQFHTEADEAAMAVECAQEQGKFEEMHELLFKNQRNQHIPELKRYARQVKVKDLKQFDQCLDSEKYRAQVQQDIQDGAEIGISGTPGFMIGTYDKEKQQVTGEILSGAQPQSAFEAIIQKYLNKQS